MRKSFKLIIATFITVLAIGFSSAQASEGRYQAYWTGKYFMILDTDNGHIWSYWGDQLMYNGRLDGDDFESPEKTKIWNQSHGKWIRK
jgi:hypothetical protein